MAEIDDLRKRLAEARAELDAQVADAAQAAARIVHLRAGNERVARGLDPRLPAAADELARIDADVVEATRRADDARLVAATTRREIDDLIGRLGVLIDHTKDVERLDGGTPMLLMPMRIETRFMGDEMWVRFYPDTWAVDTFEPVPSVSELVSVRRFWAEWWRAGGDDALRRAAWRGLVASHGSGRAGWLTRTHSPTNPGVEPARAADTDVILVVVVDQPVTAAERAALGAFWTAAWRAAGGPVAVTAAGKDLKVALGEARAAELSAIQPMFVEQIPVGFTAQTATVSTVVCEVPAVDPADTAATSWSTQARVNVLPDRFVLLGYIGGAEVLRAVGAPIPPTLAVGPDPAAGANDQMRIENGELVIPDELRWMIDFDIAVKVGMGMRIGPRDRADNGYDRLLLLGVRAGESADDGRSTLETLLAHHHTGRAGFDLVPQGTPTNNTGDSTSGYDRLDDADESYNEWFGVPDLVPTTDWTTKQDGQWLAEMLGIDVAALATVRGAGGRDQAETLAMNTALWPATWGYFLDSMLEGIDGKTIDWVRDFALRHVSGRGRIPSIRIGRQPYGIIATTAISRFDLRVDFRIDGGRRLDRRVEPRRVMTLAGILATIGDDWRALAADVAHVGRIGDPHQTLLDVVALHPASVEFHQRYAESVTEVFNRFRLFGDSDAFIDVWEALGFVLETRQLLADLGYPFGDDPAILDKMFHGSQHRLKGPVIDDRPLSETELVRAYTADGRNYLQWLYDTLGDSIDDVRRETGFAPTSPTALLYLLLRHASLLSVREAAIRLRVSSGLLDAAGAAAVRREPTFVHVAGQAKTSESPWETIYSPAAAITGDDRTLLVDVIPKLLDKAPARHLAEVRDAIGRLAGLPTARLERMLAEHLDCASHRLDAWTLGLVNHRLTELRKIPDGGNDQPALGVYLGAYGWLDEVRPRAGRLAAVRLPDALRDGFDRPAEAPLMRDAFNGGFIHAPSLDHAATAAILRSGHLANATPDEPDIMAINISSERMRLAMTIVQGVRNGQSLGALLGYRFERGLHDRHGLAEIDEFISVLREAFPAPGDRDRKLALDGLDLVRHIERVGVTTYPFGRADLAPASVAQRAAIDAEARLLLDVHDAVADLVLAESVHQAVLGNFDRVGATLDAFGSGGSPTDPAVIESPRRGKTLTHRFALHLRAGLDHTVSPVPGVAVTPRAMIEPAINEFVAAVLPAPADVALRVAWTAADESTGERVVTQADLGLQPVDLLRLLRLESDAALAELDERIIRFVETAEGLRLDTAYRVLLTEPVAGHLAMFEIAALVAHTRGVVGLARPLRANDVMPGTEAPNDRSTTLPPRQIADGAIRDVLTDLTARRAAVDAAGAPVGALLADPVANRGALLVGVDGIVDATIEQLMAAGAFALGGTSWSDVVERRRSIFVGIAADVEEVLTRWDRKLADVTDLLGRDDALPSTATDAERARILLLAEKVVSTTGIDPVPAGANALRAVVDAKVVAFRARYDALTTVVDTAADLAALLADVDALLPLADFDIVDLDLEPRRLAAIDLATVCVGRLGSVVEECDQRIALATQHLADHDAAPAGEARVDAGIAAAKALLGDETVVVPTFTLATSHGDEWEAAYSWSRSGGLAAHLLATRDEPFDDWLHGVARVRERVRSWEQMMMLCGALGSAEPALTPIQLPHAAEPWAGLEFATGFTVTSERLLYTAHYPVAFDKVGPQCGLLLDEWTEVVPETSSTTGLAFHYDRPDAEPPQAMLLVVPPTPQPTWRFDDLVDALHDTRALAELRAVDPDQVAATRYAALAPATVMSATVRGLHISANLAYNNGLAALLAN